MAQRQIIHFVERATDNLPEAFRLVFVTRVIEGMSIEETSELLESSRKPSKLGCTERVNSFAIS